MPSSTGPFSFQPQLQSQPTAEAHQNTRNTHTVSDDNFWAVACAKPADPAAIARINHKTCSLGNPAQTTARGSIRPRSMFTRASRILPQYRSPAPGINRLIKAAIVDFLIFDTPVPNQTIRQTATDFTPVLCESLKRDSVPAPQVFTHGLDRTPPHPQRIEMTAESNRHSTNSINCDAYTPASELPSFDPLSPQKHPLRKIDACPADVATPAWLHLARK